MRVRLSCVNESKEPAVTSTADLEVVDLGAPVAATSAPDFLNVREAAKVLRLSRNRTYDLANLYIDSGGTSGLPAFRFGKPIRIPRLALEAFNGGPLTWPPVEVSTRDGDLDDLDDHDDVVDGLDDVDAKPSETAHAVEFDSIDTPDQQTLPFEG